MNNITIIGNLTRDPQIRTSQAGNNVATIDIAVSSTRKDKDGNYLTDFFTAICYSKIAEFVSNNITKGTKVAIQGSIHFRDYETKDGRKGKAVEIDVLKLEKLSISAQQPQAQDLPNIDESTVQVDDDDDLPF